jgi:hypothetical protein
MFISWCIEARLRQAKAIRFEIQQKILGDMAELINRADKLNI